MAAARLGARTALIGCVGDDRRGRALVRVLAGEGVHVAHVGADKDVSTGAAVIQVDEPGQKQIMAALGANLRLRVEDIHAAADTIQASRVLLMQLEVPVESVLAAARLADAAGSRIVLDPAPPRSLPEELIARVDVIRANAAEIDALTGFGSGAAALATTMLGAQAGLPRRPELETYLQSLSTSRSARRAAK